MKKALLYLLLAIGITIVVMLVCGAALGFAGSLIEGIINYYFAVGMGILSIACIALQIVFLRMRFASYTMGRIPKEKRGLVIGYTGMAMSGLAMLYCTISDPFFSNDESLQESFAWIAKHPIPSLIGMGFIEGTDDLIIYGAIMREMLEWKHRPQIIVPVFALIIGLISACSSVPVLAIITTMTVMFQGWLYEYTRSVTPIVIGEFCYWVVIVLLTGLSIPSWCFFIAAILFVIGAILALKTMEPYKPID